MGALARQFAERVRAEELRDERLNEAATAAEGVNPKVLK